MKNKKKWFYLLVIILFIYNIQGVYAYLGLTPAIIKTDFEPGMKFFVGFTTLGIAGDQTVEIYAAGDLAEYVTFDKTNMTGGGGFMVYVDLPQNISKPGKNNLFIRIREMKEAGDEIGTRLEIGALISVKVPYPGQYAEIRRFDVADVNEGEPVAFGVNVESLGKESITASTNIEVFSNNKLLDKFDLGSKSIKMNNIELFLKKTDAGYYKPGLYNATAYVSYGDNPQILKAEKTFRVGTLFIDIVNWTREFNKSKISAFDVEIESKWNDDIENVYVGVNVSDKNGKQIDVFKTPSSNIRKWERINLKGFFNAEKAEEGIHQAKMVLFYSQKTTEKIGDINITSPPSNNTLIIVIAVIISILIIVIIIIVYLLIKRKKVNKKKYRKQND